MLTCRSAAKVNLTLDVLGRRDDGYHELQSIVHTVGLWDTLRFERTHSARFELRCNIGPLESEDNLCLKAAHAWLRAAHDHGMMIWQGTRITLHKAIPSGAGLGGGSGNAAATLLGLTRLYRAQLPDRTLHRIALSLGADVPFFLRGGCALMEGVGERLTPLPPLNGWLLVAQPAARLDTPRVYTAWDALRIASARATPAALQALNGALAGPHHQQQQQRHQSELQATRTHPWPAHAPTSEASSVMVLAHLLRNDLSAAAASCGVAVESMLQALMRHGAQGAAMTGSGSAVFGVFRDEDAAWQALRRVRPAALNPVDSLNPVNKDSREKAPRASETPHAAPGSVWSFAAVAPLCPSGVVFADEQPATAIAHDWI